MPTIRDIRRRITGVGKIKQITRAMKMVATVKYRKANETLAAARLYSGKMSEMLFNLLGSIDNPYVLHPLLECRRVKNRLYVVIGSDRGFCGSFNSNLGQRVLEEIRKEEKTPVHLYIIGKKMRDFFKNHAVQADTVKMNLFNKISFESIEAVSQELVDLFISGEYDELTLFYNEFKSVSQPRITKAKILPLEINCRVNKSPDVSNYLFEPEKKLLLPNLIIRYFKAQFYGVMVESNTAEEASRMSMMDQASKNADDVIDQLRLSFNKARQLAITHELADITTGVEAMS